MIPTHFHLDLSSNQIKDNGTIAMAKALESNTKLNCLYLNNNQTTNIGLKYIAKSLKINKKLKEGLIYLDLESELNN